jgi:hypothetical protein
MLGVVGFQAEGLHPSALDDQEVQDVDRTESDVVVLHLQHRTVAGKFGQLDAIDLGL